MPDAETSVSTAVKAVVIGGGLPSPLHLAPALLSYKLLSLPERSRVARAALAFRGIDPSDPKADQIQLGSWMAKHGQNWRAAARCGTCS